MPSRVALTGFVPTTELVGTRRSKRNRGSFSVPAPFCNFRSTCFALFVLRTGKHYAMGMVGIQMSSYRSHARPTFQPSVSTRPKAINAGGQKLANLLLIVATVRGAVGGAPVGENVTPSSCACSTKAVMCGSDLDVRALLLSLFPSSFAPLPQCSIFYAALQ
jgi:hypothetical protein